MRIEDAIQQPHFPSPLHRAHVNILYTASWLNQRTTQVLKPYDISVQQFNILRILKGRRGEPATIKLLTERMLDQMSNASRLVDKLKSKGLVERAECATDRRRVDITITPSGLELVDNASEELNRRLYESWDSLSSTEADTLSNLLDLLRENN